MKTQEANLLYEPYPEPIEGCLQALRHLIRHYDPQITEARMYGMPFFYFRNKRFCYLWVDQKYQQPYVGFHQGYRINHPALEQAGRVQIKVLRIDPTRDIPVKTLYGIIKKALSFC